MANNYRNNFNKEVRKYCAILDVLHDGCPAVCIGDKQTYVDR